MNERWVLVRVNRMVYLISIFIGIALSGGYFFDYIDSEVPPAFFFVFVSVVGAQLICNAVVYLRDKGSPEFKYVALAGCTAVYFVAMFGRIDALLGLNEDSIALYIYVIIIPYMIMYIGYFNMKLIKIMAVGTIIANAVKVVFHIYIGYTSGDNISEYLVQMGCIIITVVSVHTVARVSFENYMKKLKETEDAAHQAELARGQAEEAHEAVMSSIQYAGKIQRNLLPPDAAMSSAFSDFSAIWKPRDVVGGDVYWMRQFDEGTVLCICDCTGHGTPGALLTMLVTSVLENVVRTYNCDDTADVVLQLDRKLSSVLHVQSENEQKRGIMDIDDGCDLAVLFVAGDGSVRFSSGNIPVFVCDGNNVDQHKGQKLFVGEGKLESKDEVKIISIQVNPDNKFYIASDGLFDQIGGDQGIQYGYNAFKEIILSNHGETLGIITGKIWDEYERYRGQEDRRDDFELVAFKP